MYIFTKSSHLEVFRPVKGGCWVRNGLPIPIHENEQVVTFTTFEWMKEGDKKLKMREMKVMEDAVDMMSICVIYDSDLESD